MKIALPTGGTVVDYPLLEQAIVSHSAERIVIDEGAIRIDSANHSLDESHLVLDGVLTAGQNYFKIVKSGQTLLNCDHTGQLHCHQDLTAPVISGMLTEIGTLQTNDLAQNSSIATNTNDLTNATHNPVHGTIVRRNNNDSTFFTHIQSDLVTVIQEVAMYADAQLSFTPQDSQGINKQGYTYRFGRNQEELNDESGAGDGLEFKENGNLGNQILIQVNREAPTIELQVDKATSFTPYILFRNVGTEKLVQIDKTGIATRYHVFANASITPGQILQTDKLINGPQTHRFVLFSAWTDQIDEVIIEISSVDPQSLGEFRMIENVDVCLDDKSVAQGQSDIHSRIFVKRWGQYSNTHQRVYFVLGCDFHNNEVEIMIDSLIRLSFNNKLVL